MANCSMIGSMLALPARRSGMAGRRIAAKPAARAVRNVRVAAMASDKQTFDSNWLRKDPTVLGISFLGWTVPSNIPVSGFGGKSLFGLFMGSIGSNLAHWPTGPALDDKFWLYLITWHVGLFLAMFLGQIGVQARKQGYFD